MRLGNSCQYCNTPLVHAHQIEMHLNQPCRGKLLAEMEEIKEEKKNQQQRLLNDSNKQFSELREYMRELEIKVANLEAENKDLKAQLQKLQPHDYQEQILSEPNATLTMKKIITPKGSKQC